MNGRRHRPLRVAPVLSRRRFLGWLLAGLALPGLSALAAPPRALREMRIQRVPEMGLEIWLENQPAWEAEIIQVKGRPQLVAQSPDHFHPPAVITYGGWPDQRVDEAGFETMAHSAIRHGSLNFGLNKDRSRQIVVKPARYGVLSGFEGDFAGRVEGVAMDVKVFVGQQSGRFPVVLTVYTLAGKMPFLSEVIRRGFTKLKYL